MNFSISRRGAWDREKNRLHSPWEWKWCDAEKVKVSLWTIQSLLTCTRHILPKNILLRLSSLLNAYTAQNIFYCTCISCQKHIMHKTYFYCIWMSCQKHIMHKTYFYCTWISIQKCIMYKTYLYCTWISCQKHIMHKTYLYCTWISGQKHIMHKT